MSDESKMQDVSPSPTTLICPITQEHIKEPEFCVADGITYEKSALVKWISKKTTKTSPIGAPLTTRVHFSNKILQFKHPLVCPLTKEPFKDPVIYEADGWTYEHEALVQALQSTICKGSVFRNQSGQAITKLTIAYPNKSLWNDKSLAKDRKEFVIPAIEKPTGWQMRGCKALIQNQVLTADVLPQLIAVSAFDLFESSEKQREEYINSIQGEGTPVMDLRMENCYFTEGCVKMMKFQNCKFVGCVFRTCMCSSFESCIFQDCVFLKCHFRREFGCRGTSFVGCSLKFDPFGTVDNILIDSGPVTTFCSTREELLNCWTFKQALKLDLTLF